MMMSCLSVLGSSAKNPGRFGWVIGTSRSRSPRMIIVGATIFFGSVSGIFVLRSRRIPFGAFAPHCAVSLIHASTTMASVAGDSNRPRAFSGDRKSTRLNSSHTVISTLSLHDALPIYWHQPIEVAEDDHRRSDDLLWVR